MTTVIDVPNIHYVRLDANLRSALRMLFPDEMTPHAHRIIENILNRNMQLAVESFDKAVLLKALEETGKKGS